MHFADGGSLETDVVVISAGIRPRDELARACGLDVAPRGGIVINGECRTSDESIYAIGECAAYEGRIFGLVAPGYQMARIAAARVLGSPSEVFAGADMSTKLKLLGVEVGSIGDAHATTPGARVYSFFDQRREVYKKLVVDAEGKKLLGAVLVGDTADYSHVAPDRGQCHGAAREPGNHAVSGGRGHRRCTPGQRAGRAAGQRPDLFLQQRVQGRHLRRHRRRLHHGRRAEDQDQGRHHLRRLHPAGDADPQRRAQEARRQRSTPRCASTSRTRASSCSTWCASASSRPSKTPIAKHGRGLGCDICKPAVASILASCWNEFVLKKRNAVLQDTNDYFLANMQKDGTYSVVPRVPGGEITPDRSHRHRRRGEEVRPVHQDHRRPAHRHVRRAGAPAAVDLARAHRRRFRIRSCLRQGAAHREELRRFDLVPLRRAGLGRPRHRPGESLQGPARAAQDQVRRVRLHA